MDDSALAEFLGIAGDPLEAKMIAAFTAAERATFERMATVEWELKLWQEGIGPKPAGVIVCREHRGRR